MSEKPTVAFLGPKASYTHQAALELFPVPANLTPCITIEDVFSAVQSGHVDRGVVPFENSSNGSVIFTLDLFADLHNNYPDILVCAETYIDVHHCLLGRKPPTHHAVQAISPTSSGHATPTTEYPTPLKPRAKPLCSLSHVQKIYSHPMAWGQCKAFLAGYLKTVEKQDVSSTSKAAEVVSQDESGTSAAISSRMAAEVFGLDVLVEGMEDKADNTTRFFVLMRRGDAGVDHEEEKSGSRSSRGAVVDGQSQAGQTGVDGDGSQASYKSLISFTVDHGDPGALANALEVFKRFGLNLTSINTRPSGIAPWNYIFFVEFHGRRREEVSDDPVNNALKQLGDAVDQWRWLGSWRNKLIK